MADISNKTLALLVGVALVVSLIGLFSGPSTITGKVTTGTGTAKLEVLGKVSITVTDQTIDFLNGTIQEGDNCTIDSADGSQNTGCEGDWLATKDVFEINNSGTVDINVTIQATSNAATWVTGDGSEKFWFNDVEEDCAGFAPAGNTEFAAAATEYDLCGDLPQNGKQNISMKVAIPDDATQGQRTNTITFTASTA